MFSKAQAKVRNNTIGELKDAMKNPTWRIQVLEKGAPIWIQAEGAKENDKAVSQAAIAARSAVIRVCQQAADQYVANGKGTREAGFVLAFDIAMSLIGVYSGRGRSSLQKKTIQLLASEFGGSGVLTRGGITLSMFKILKMAKELFCRATGAMLGPNNMPNFLTHLVRWANASRFLGTIHEGIPIPRCVEKEDYDNNESVYFRASVNNGAQIYGIATYREYDHPATKTTITALDTTRQWFTGNPSLRNTPMTITVTGPGVGITTTMETVSFAILGALEPIEETDWFYQDTWMDAGAIPAQEDELAALWCAYWGTEMQKRSSSLQSADGANATKLMTNFEDHSPAWFLQNRIPRLRTLEKGNFPFLNTRIDDWKSIAEGLKKLGLAIATCALGITETSDTENGKLDRDTVKTILGNVFPNNEVLSVWQRYAQDVMKWQQEMNTWRKGGKTRDAPARPVVNDYSTEKVNVQALTHIKDVVEGLKVRKTGATNNMVTYRACIVGVSRHPAALCYADHCRFQDMRVEGLKKFVQDQGLRIDAFDDPTGQTDMDFIQSLIGSTEADNSHEMSDLLDKAFKTDEKKSTSPEKPSKKPVKNWRQLKNVDPKFGPDFEIKNVWGDGNFKRLRYDIQEALSETTSFNSKTLTIVVGDEVGDNKILDTTGEYAEELQRGPTMVDGKQDWSTYLEMKTELLNRIFH